MVSAATRDRVLKAVSDTGYRPNVAARNLRARRSMMVLVVVPNLANPFYGEILRGIDDGLVEAGYGIIVGNLDRQTEREARYVDVALSGQVDGVLLLSGRVPVGSSGQTICDAGLPIVTVCASIPGLDATHIVIDDRAAAREVATHLLSLNHTRFGYLAGPASSINETHRRRGYLETIRAAGFSGNDIVILPGRYDIQAGVEAAEEWLRLAPRPTALFASCDAMALGFMKRVITAGCRIPDEVSIVGFDGIEFAELAEPTLTTVRQPRYRLGRAAANGLLARLRGEQGGNQSVRLEAKLCIGGTTGQAPVAAPAVSLVHP